jgi:hypothetical protein
MMRAIMPELARQGETHPEKVDDFRVLQAVELKPDFIRVTVDPQRPNL